MSKFKYTVWIWFFFMLLTVSIVGFLTAVRYGLFGALPDYKELENPRTNLATQIVSSDHILLGTYFRENRTNVAYKDISPYVVQALVATEDERFHEHSGIDLRGLTRAVVYMGSKGGASTISQQLAKLLFTGERANSFAWRVSQKFKEWIIAVQLEKHYTKSEIITMYLNKFDWINQAVGIKSAAQIYFSKDPADLTITEAATLVGMLKNPALFNPARDKRMDTVVHRRNVVLAQMLKNNSITRQEFDSLKTLELGLRFQSVDHKEGAATYFREVLRSELKTIFNKEEKGEYVYAKADGSKYDIYKDGLKVYTTIDSRMQNHAEWAVEQHLKNELQPDFFKDLKRKRNAPFDWRLSKSQIEKILEAAIHRTSRWRIATGRECPNCGRGYKYVEELEKEEKKYFQCTAEDCLEEWEERTEEEIKEIFNTPRKMRVFSWKGEIDTTMTPLDSIKYYKSFLQTGFMAMDPHTGHIKAWVGGINYKYFSYDHVKQGRRQVGSTFKPFVYSLAMQQGYSPCDKFPNVKTCFEMPDGQDPWCPPNADHEYGGEVTLKYALANSMNTITAKLMKQLTPQLVVNYARKLGITSPLDPVPSLCLGVADISVYEMVGANATFANKGVWTEPIFIEKIVDKNGNNIYQKFPEKVQAMTEKAAYTTLELMKGVTQGGSGIRLRIDLPNRDYDGFRYPVAGKTGTTNNHSDGWFMGITKDLVAGCWVGADDRSVHFASLHLGQGANMALPIWGYFMKKVYEDPSIKVSKEDFEMPLGFHSDDFKCDDNSGNDKEETINEIDDFEFN